jgi:hypothetical protein
MLLFFDQSGPLMRYQDGVLDIEDLNPEQIIRWQMSRLEMIRLGWWCLIAAWM